MRNLFLLSLILISCNQNKKNMEWMDHGGRIRPDIKVLADKAAVIFIGSVILIRQDAVEYSSGDAHIPTVWEMNVKLIPETFVKGKIVGTLGWEGRHRPNHPDPMMEDLFWIQWMKDKNQKVIVFLSESSKEILYAEDYSLSGIEELKKSIRK